MSFACQIKLCCLFCAIVALVFAPACRFSERKSDDTTPGLVVVNAPVNGKVRRVLVSENANVELNAALIEIGVVSNAQAATETQDDSQRRARNEAQTGAELIKKRRRRIRARRRRSAEG